MKLRATHSFAIFQAARQGMLATLLVAALAGCGGPGTSETAGSGAPVAPPAHSQAHDSVQAALTTPAPDATATEAPKVDTATAKPAVSKPLDKPRTALPQPAAAQPLAAAEAAPPAPAPEGAPAAAPEPVAVAAVPSTRTQVGRVLDEDGRPLVGATIMLKGSAKGTSTDANGNYTFEVPGGNDTFVVGYGGYADEVATSHDGQPLNVTLVPDPNSKAKSRRARR